MVFILPFSAILFLSVGSFYRKLFSLKTRVFCSQQIQMVAFCREKGSRKPTQGDFQVWKLFAVLTSPSPPTGMKVRNCYIIRLNS